MGPASTEGRCSRLEPGLPPGIFRYCFIHCLNKILCTYRMLVVVHPEYFISPASRRAFPNPSPKEAPDERLTTPHGTWSWEKVFAHHNMWCHHICPFESNKIPCNIFSYHQKQWRYFNIDQVTRNTLYKNFNEYVYLNTVGKQGGF